MHMPTAGPDAPMWGTCEMGRHAGQGLHSVMTCNMDMPIQTNDFGQGQSNFGSSGLGRKYSSMYLNPVKRHINSIYEHLNYMTHSFIYMMIIFNAHVLCLK